MLFGTKPFGDFASDLRGADYRALLVVNRRNRERDVNEAAVLVAADRFVVIDCLARTNTSDDLDPFIRPMRWAQDRHRAPDDFFCAVSKQPFGAPVPALDRSVEAFADDCIVRGFNNRYEAPRALVIAPCFGHVDKKVHRADKGTFIIEHRRRIGPKADARTVWPLGISLDAAHRLASTHGHGHGTVGVLERCPIDAEKLPRAAPFALEKLRPAAPKRDRRFIVISDASLGIGRVNGNRKVVEDFPINGVRADSVEPVHARGRVFEAVGCLAHQTRCSNGAPADKTYRAFNGRTNEIWQGEAQWRRASYRK